MSLSKEGKTHYRIDASVGKVNLKHTAFTGLKPLEWLFKVEK